MEQVKFKTNEQIEFNKINQLLAINKIKSIKELIFNKSWQSFCCSDFNNSKSVLITINSMENKYSRMVYYVNKFVKRHMLCYEKASRSFFHISNFKNYSKLQDGYFKNCKSTNLAYRNIVIFLGNLATFIINLYFVGDKENILNFLNGLKYINYNSSKKICVIKRLVYVWRVSLLGKKIWDGLVKGITVSSIIIILLRLLDLKKETKSFNTLYIIKSI